MINCANMFAGNDNPALKVSTHATEKLTETAFDTASTFADNMLKFSQALSKCRNPQETFAAVSNLAQENTAAAITATQRACTALLETFSELGSQCASALESTAGTFSPAVMASAGTSARARRRDKE